jgi:hypothetical protein
MTRVIKSIGINNFCKIIFLYKIYNYKIENQPNIRIIKKKKTKLKQITLPN